MMLEVMMADCPGWPHPPTFSWNAGMVIHVLKSNPVLRELEHVQVDGLGTAYLFFYDKQGHRGLRQDAAHAIQTHMEEAFFLRGRAENPVHNIPVVNAGESDSSGQLVGSVPQQARRASGVEEVA